MSQLHYCGLSLLKPVKAVNNMNKSTVPISIISKVADLWYKQNKKTTTFYQQNR